MADAGSGAAQPPPLPPAGSAVAGKHGRADDASDGSDSDSAIEKDPRPECMYGVNCYRKNPVHFQQFRHPHLDPKPKVKRVKSVSTTLPAQLARVPSDVAKFPALLPDDVWSVIVPLFSVRDLSRIFRASKACFKIGRYVTRLDFSAESNLDVDAALAFLAKACPNTTTVSVAGSRRFSNVGMRALPLLRSLTELDMSRTTLVTEPGMRHLLECTKLVKLVCVQTRLDANAVSNASHLPALTQLDLSGSTRMSDVSLGHLSHCTSLRDLGLCGLTNLTAVGLRRLAPLVQLETLRLSRCLSVGDELAALLAPFHRLRTLVLSYNRLSDAFLQGMVKLPLAAVLESLDVTATAVSAPQLLQACAALPALRRLQAQAIQGFDTQAAAPLRQRGIDVLVGADPLTGQLGGLWAAPPAGALAGPFAAIWPGPAGPAAVLAVPGLGAPVYAGGFLFGGGGFAGWAFGGGGGGGGAGGGGGGGGAGGSSDDGDGSDCCGSDCEGCSACDGDASGSHKSDDGSDEAESEEDKEDDEEEESSGNSTRSTDVEGDGSASAPSIQPQ